MELDRSCSSQHSIEYFLTIYYIHQKKIIIYLTLLILIRIQEKLNYLSPIEYRVQVV